jgi:sulfide:quinone oxidoreductase
MNELTSRAKSPRRPLEVVIAGGGVAALEAALALRELAPGGVRTTLLAPGPDFILRPLSVQEPFGYRGAARYPLEDIAHELEIEYVADCFSGLDAAAAIVDTEAGRHLRYDALLLAMGARARPAFGHGTTLDDSRLDEQLHGLIQDVEGGYAKSIVFVIPSAMPWPLPIYELALMTAGRAYDMQIDLEATIVTPEDAPLAFFGGEVSAAVSELLAQNRVTVLTSAHASIPEPRTVILHPSGVKLHANRIVALPELFGPSSPGVPKQASGGFLSVDPFCRVRGLTNVFAAGDATDFPVKHGGIAAQQADVAAEAIAAMADASVHPRPFNPVIQGVLLNPGPPLYLSAHVTGGHGTSSKVSTEPSWQPPAKVVARFLAPYLDQFDKRRGQAGRSVPIGSV